MRTIAEALAGIIRRSPYLEEAMGLGLLNHSALARHLKPEVEREVMKKVKDGALIVALNRLAQSSRAREGRPKSLFRKAPDLIVRLNLFEVTYANSDSLAQRQRKLLESLSPRSPFFVTFTRGINETTTVASRELRERVVSAFKGERLISQIAGLASVTVMLPKGTALIPGVYSYLLKALAWEGLNVVEVVSTLNEFTIILEDRKIDSAFGVIKRLFG
jgi:hypothetical protein